MHLKRWTKVTRLSSLKQENWAHVGERRSGAHSSQHPRSAAGGGLTKTLLEPRTDRDASARSLPRRGCHCAFTETLHRQHGPSLDFSSFCLYPQSILFVLFYLLRADKACGCAIISIFWIILTVCPVSRPQDSSVQSALSLSMDFTSRHSFSATTLQRKPRSGQVPSSTGSV